MLLLGSIDCGLLSSLTTGLRHRRLLAKGALSRQMPVWPLRNPPFGDTMPQGGEAGPRHLIAIGESRGWGMKKGRSETRPPHLRGEATPLSQEEVEVPVDSDDDDGKDPKGASDNLGSEDAVDDERHLFQEKSNVVEFNSTIETHWNDALYLDRDAASSPSPASRSSSGSGQVERAQSFALGKKIPAYRFHLTS